MNNGCYFHISLLHALEVIKYLNPHLLKDDPNL
jgi:hypothetical protein